MRPFRLLWCGQVVSSLGDTFQLIALAWLIMERTESPFALTGLFVAATLPRVLFLLAGGVATDRYAARTVMLWSDAARSVVVGVLALLAIAGELGLPALYGLVVAQAAAGAFFAPASASIVPRLVPPERLQAANSLYALSQQLAMVLGAVLGGTIVAFSGPTAALVLNAGSFAVAAACTAGLPTGDHIQAGDASKSAFADARAGIAYVLGQRWLRVLFCLEALLNFVLAGPILVGLPLLARGNLAVGANGFGLLLAGFSLGSITGLMLAGARETPKGRGPKYCLLILLQAPCIAAVPALPFAAAVVALVGFGLLNGVTEVLWLGLLQERTAPAMLGRVMSIATLALLGLQPVSQLAAGIAVDKFGPGPLFLGVGGLVICAASVGLLSPTFRAID
jgi:DHA3 family tetracycline resistance protein-like MFS transporter